MPSEWRAIKRNCLCPSLNEPLKSKGELQKLLYHILRGDENIHSLQTILQDRPGFLEETAKTVFPKLTTPSEALVQLIALSIFARPGPNDLPLLPARYHVFARALEGAFICLNQPAHERDGKEPLPSLFLRRYKFCPHCSSRVFELANCTRCGMAYLIGDQADGASLVDESTPAFSIIPGAEYFTQSSVMYDAIEAKQTSYFVLGG